MFLQGANWKDLDVNYDDNLYLASENQILSIARDQLELVDSVMLVGHNPGMDYTLMGLCSGAPTMVDGKLMTTAAFAIIQCDNAQLENPVLEAFHRAKEL